MGQSKSFKMDEYRDIMEKDGSCTGMLSALGVSPKTRASLRVFRTRSARSSESRKFVVGGKGASVVVGMGGSCFESGLIDVLSKTGRRVIGLSCFEVCRDKGLEEIDGHEPDLQNWMGDSRVEVLSGLYFD
jgi:hypothetical protein